MQDPKPRVIRWQFRCLEGQRQSNKRAAKRQSVLYASLRSILAKCSPSTSPASRACQSEGARTLNHGSRQFNQLAIPAFQESRISLCVVQGRHAEKEHGNYKTVFSFRGSTVRPLAANEDIKASFPGGWHLVPGICGFIRCM